VRRERETSAVLAAVLLAVVAGGTSGAAEPDPLCIVFITPAPGFGQVEIAIDLIINESEMAAIMNGVDLNDDLVMDDAEVRNYEWSSDQRIVWQTYDEFNKLGAKKLLLDDRMAQWIDVLWDLKRFEGPVDPTRNVTVTEVRTYPFPHYGGPQEMPSHTLVGGEKAQGRPPGVSVETAVISAPSGWWVWSVNGTAVRQTSVTIKGFDYKSLFTIVYAKDGMTPEGRPVGWEMQILMYTIIAIVPVVAIGITVFALARRKERRGAKTGDGDPAASPESAVQVTTTGRKS
jgi:hypothetical protein